MSELLNAIVGLGFIIGNLFFWIGLIALIGLIFSLFVKRLKNKRRQLAVLLGISFLLYFILVGTQIILVAIGVIPTICCAIP